MKLDLSISSYIKILNEIGHWSIISMEDLYKLGHFPFSYDYLGKKIKVLEKNSLLKSIRDQKTRKYLYLTAQALKYVSVDSKKLLNEDIIQHEVILSRLMLEINKYEFVKSVEVNPKCYGELEPDALIFASKSNIDKTIALELELTQKSFKRIQNKLSDYSRSNYSQCLIITNKKRIIEIYREQIEEYELDYQKKFIFVYLEDLYSLDINFENIRCLYMGKVISYAEIFGKKTSAIPSASLCDSTLRPDSFPK